MERVTRTGRRQRRFAARSHWGYVAISAVLLMSGLILTIATIANNSRNDPISAAPVNANAVVVQSHTCPSGEVTTVRLRLPDADVTTTLSGCGFSTGSLLPVQYAAGDPRLIRLAGAADTAPVSWRSFLLPASLLLGGIAGMLIVVVNARTSGRSPASAPSISLADLQERLSSRNRPEDD